MQKKLMSDNINQLQAPQPDLEKAAVQKKTFAEDAQLSLLKRRLLKNKLNVAPTD
jgi:hypothetical protein